MKCNRFLIIFHSTVSESNKKVDFARWNPIIHSKPVRNQIFMLNHRFLLACNQFIILLLIYYLLSFTYICILYKKYISIIIVSSKQKSASETSFFGTLKKFWRLYLWLQINWWYVNGVLIIVILKYIIKLIISFSFYFQVFPVKNIFWHSTGHLKVCNNYRYKFANLSLQI